MKPFLAMLGLLFFSFTSFKSTDDEMKFVQFVVQEEISKELAMDIDEHMKMQPGVVASRMDPISHKYFVLFNSHYTYDQTYFEEVFKKYGLEFKCYREGIRGVDQIIHQTTDCE